MNGLDATRQIIKDSPGAEVLILTMHHSEELAREVLQAGARGYVLKSGADRKLVPTIENLPRHRPYLASAVAEVVLGDYRRLAEKADDGAPGDPLTSREGEIVSPPLWSPRAGVRWRYSCLSSCANQGVTPVVGHDGLDRRGPYADGAVIWRLTLAAARSGQIMIDTVSADVASRTSG